MVKQLWKRQFVDDIVSARFLLAFVLVLATIVVFSLIFVSHYQTLGARYSKNTIENDRKLAESSKEIVDLLSTPLEFVMKPRPSRFIADGYEGKIPQGISFIPKGYTFVVGETKNPPKGGSSNSTGFYAADLTFAVQFLLSFFAILLTYNALSSEKEKGTLRLVLSNPVKRADVVLAKYLSALATILLPLLAGLIVGLIFLSLSSAVLISSAFALGLFMFIAVSLLYISVFILIGLLFSALSHSSKNSLVFGLLVWTFLVVIFPKSSGLFLTLKRFDVPTAQNIEELAERAEREIWNRYSHEDLTTRGGQDESTKLNAKVGLETQRAREEVYDFYLRKKIGAVETLRKLNFISPASLFEYSASSIAGTGIFHFQKLWEQVRQYRNQYLEFFKAEDGKDPDSFHLYFHPDYLSRKPVDFNKIPKFEEKEIGAGERIREVLPYILLLILYNLLLFVLVFYRFQKYDVR
jgi:ABC-type transport system involved in multi-copper enzyme maturation permease subunit